MHIFKTQKQSISPRRPRYALSQVFHLILIPFQCTALFDKNFNLHRFRLLQNPRIFPVKLPPAVEKDSMILQGDDIFQPRNLEELQEFLDELPELA